MAEPWLSGPVAGIDAYLQPVAHALLQARDDLARAAEGLDGRQLWLRPGGAAAPGFHLRHIAGSIERLLTYARGQALSDAQVAAARAEQAPDDTAAAPALVALAQRAIDGALEQLRGCPRERLLEPREVGRARLPSTLLGLLFHVAEHTQRHTGQLIATAKAVRAEGGAA
ncbi:MAG TPA: DinB family protein [Vicinamibacteria bacterium]|nr:DinB family protein [Vicinamibacteria bacterium]